MKLVPVAVAIFIKKNPDGLYHTFIQQRTAGSLKGLWEFPGGKIESGESSWDALCREIEEEVFFKIKTPGTLMGIYPVDYGEVRVLLNVFTIPWAPELESAAGKIVTLQKNADITQWKVDLLPANIRLVEDLCQGLYHQP
jgi:8-oxo-dGTP diphosphatase